MILNPSPPEHFPGKTPVTAQGTIQMTEDMHIDFDRHFKAFHETLHHVMTQFKKEYVPGLQPRGKWRKRMENLAEGAIIMVFDSSCPKYLPLAVVTKVYRGQDGLVHTVKYRVASGKEYKRDIRHVSLLLQADDAD